MVTASSTPNKATSASTEVLYVPRWLILGAFPSTSMNPTLLDAVPNETMLMPSPGQITEGRTWQVVTANPVDLLDPKLKLGLQERCYGYAFTYVYVQESEKVELLAGSDDGIAIWVNGVNVHYNDTWRGVELDNDVVPVVLRKGWNAILLKISQGNGDWGFVFRIRRLAPKGKMSFSLNRAVTKLGLGDKGEVTGLTIVPDTEHFLPVVQDHELFLTLRANIFSDSRKAADHLTLVIVDDAGQVFGETALPKLEAYESINPAVTFAMRSLFQALAMGRTVRLETRSSLGTSAVALAADAFLGMLLDTINGIDLAEVGGEQQVPALFRGQPALLEVLSQHELTSQGQTIASHPLRAARSYTPAETAGGTIDLTLAIPTELRDPVVHLYFGSAEVRTLIQRIRFVVDELVPETKAAHDAVLAGMSALADGNFLAAVQALEQVLTALAGTLTDYSSHQITLVGHAHIDMNWLWDTAETKKVTHDTFRQVLDFMEEFPQFTFSQSQASTYRYIEELDPAMFARIRQRVREGRWELLGGMVDESDTNLSGGEALARSFLMGQRYFLSRFEKMAKVGWLPDDFGHIAQLPQLLQLAGMSAFYGHRCMPQLGPFRWEGIDGTQVINYITPTYNGEVSPRLRDMPTQYDPKHGKGIWVYGVGDHGGGPTRRDITRALFYQQVPTMPQFTFGTAADFFASVQDDAPDYPVHKGEMQYIFEGCYTSIARIKEGNRRCENALFSAELLAAFMAPRGYAYPKDKLYDAWYTVAFNQFHDILCGSAVQESNRESIAAYDLALEKAADVRYGALRFLAANVPTKEQMGQPLLVFNPQPQPRTDIVEAEIFSYVQPPAARIGGWGGGGAPEARMKSLPITPVDLGQGAFPTITLTDADGRPVDAQVVSGKQFPNGYRLKVRFLAKELPACGWRVFYARPEQEAAPVDGTLQVKGTTIDTPFLTVRVDPKSGHVTRIFDKQGNRELLPRGGKANVLKVYMEKPHGMSAWDLGPVSEVHTLDEAELVRVIEHGPVRATVEVWRRWNRSLFVQRIFVYRDLPRVEFEVEAHWFEQGGPTVDAPTLRVAFPLQVKKGAFTCETPYAALQRPMNGQEVPAQRWIDLSTAEGGAALLNDGKYGHRCTGNVLETTLLRASYEPDPYPDQGQHIIHYALLPHDGDWQAAGIAQAGQDFNLPLLALETPPGRPGTLPETGGLLTLTPSTALLSGVKRAEDDDALVIRFCEMHGQPTDAVLTLTQPVRSAVRVNLLEQPLEGVAAPVIDGHTIRVAVKAHEVVTVKVEMA